MEAWQQGWDFGFHGTSRFGSLQMVLDPTLGNIRFPLGFHLLIPRRNQLMAAHGNAHFPWISSQGRCNSMNSICSHPLLLEHLCKRTKAQARPLQFPDPSEYQYLKARYLSRYLFLREAAGKSCNSKLAEKSGRFIPMQKIPPPRFGSQKC